jgi:hypothetical protein
MPVNAQRVVGTHFVFGGMSLTLKCHGRRRALKCLVSGLSPGPCPAASAVGPCHAASAVGPCHATLVAGVPHARTGGVYSQCLRRATPSPQVRGTPPRSRGTRGSQRRVHGMAGLVNCLGARACGPSRRRTGDGPEARAPNNAADFSGARARHGCLVCLIAHIRYTL